jgi:hypothetical protein
MKNINERGYQLFPFCLFPSPLPSQWGPVPKMYEKTIDNKQVYLGSGIKCYLYTWFGIREEFFHDPGSPTHIMRA